jgi:hypothetical protein
MEKRYIYGSLTRISDLEVYPFEVEKIMNKKRWGTGDYVVGKYLCPEHRHIYAGPVATGDFCELPTGRHRYYLPGDLVVGAFGRRNATLEICGDWRDIQHPNPDGGPTIMDDLSGSCMFGKLTSKSPHFPRQGKFEYVGHIFRKGKKVCMTDFVPSVSKSLAHAPHVPTILVVGTAMSSGKSSTARVAIRCMKEMGSRKVVAVKLTGAGFYKDILGFSDAGADAVLDFVDVGLPSSVIPKEEYRKKLHKLFGMIQDHQPDILVVEAGASPCEKYNGNVVLEAFSHHPSLFLILCASDAYSVLGAKQYLASFGLVPNMVAGIIANTNAGQELVGRMAGFSASSLNTDESIEDFAGMICKELGVA